MDSFCWMCSRSFKLCVQIWRVFGGLLHHLLLMMCLDCPLVIRHKKGEYILMEIGGDFEFLKLWSFRLFLGASWCIYLLAHDVFILMYLFLWVVYVRGRYFVLCFYFYYCFLFHMCYIDYWFILKGYSWYMSFIFLFCEIKNFILLVFSTHAFMCLLSVLGI